MKVIVAGMSKTGTKSINAALQRLGYKVYDFFENAIYLQDDYEKIFREGWSTEDFRRMYENVDAVVDAPAFYFWEEIHKAFPDAKIILSVRETEEEWIASVMNQYQAINADYIFKFCSIFSPTYRGIRNRVSMAMVGPIFGLPSRGVFEKVKINKQMMLLKYRAHNAHVLQNAPSDKLLVYQCKEGWEPLCKFLGVSVPDQPYPHMNKAGSVMKEFVNEHSLVKKFIKEAKIYGSLYLASFLFSGFVICRVGPGQIYRGLSEGISNLVSKVY